MRRNSIRGDSIRWDSIGGDSIRWDSIRWDSIRRARLPDRGHRGRAEISVTPSRFETFAL
jgi:hypothetical protein